jgi:esterase/lipase
MDKLIEIENPKGWKIVGNLNHINNNYLVIICHGFTANKDIQGIKNIANLLGKSGYSSFRFDFSGNGSSGGDKILSLNQQVEDLFTVIKYFQNYKHLVLVGHSLGILPVCICSPKTKIDSVISINGFFDGGIKSAQFKRTYMTLKILQWFEPRIKKEMSLFEQQFHPEMIRKPMLVIYTPNDEILDYHQSEKWFNQLKCEKTIFELPLSDHGLNKLKDAEMSVKSIIKWIKTGYDTSEK